MRKMNLVLVGIIVLAVILSGCAGKKPAEQEQKQGPTLEGNISVPGEKDLAIEDMQTSQAEAVDMGSLI